MSQITQPTVWEGNLLQKWKEFVGFAVIMTTFITWRKGRQAENNHITEITWKVNRIKGRKSRHIDLTGITSQQVNHNRFTALCPGPPVWASASIELLDFMMQGKINRGRHTNHPAVCHFIQTNQCPPPPPPHFLTGQMPFLPPNQQCQITESNRLTATKYLQHNH